MRVRGPTGVSLGPACLGNRPIWVDTGYSRSCTVGRCTERTEVIWLRSYIHPSDPWPLPGHPEAMKIRGGRPPWPTAAVLGASKAPKNPGEAGGSLGTQTVALVVLD